MPIRPAIETLNRIEGGCFMDDVGQRLSELVLAVDQTGKPGSITLKIDIRRATAGAMAVKGKVSIKKPEQPAFEALLFPTPEGNLLAEDPRQQRLELREVVDQNTGEIRQVKGA